jgi:hypothetical protein
VAEKSLAEHVLDSIVGSDLYDVDRSGFRLAVRSRRGNHVAAIQFNDVPDSPRCVIRRPGHMIAQCHYSAGEGWVIFPVESGKIAKKPLTRPDLLRFLKEFEAVQSRETHTVAMAS